MRRTPTTRRRSRKTRRARRPGDDAMGKASGAAGTVAGRRRDGQGVEGADLGGRGLPSRRGRLDYQSGSGSHKFAGRNLRGPLELGSDLGPQFLQMDSYLEK